MPKKIKLPFNPDMMTVSEMKEAITCLRGILQDFDKHVQGEDSTCYDAAPLDYKEFAMRVMQVRDYYDIT